MKEKRLSQHLFTALLVWLIVTMFMPLSVKAQNHPTEYFWGDVTIKVGEEKRLYLGDDFLYAQNMPLFQNKWTIEDYDTMYLDITSEETSNPYCTIKGLQKNHVLPIRVSCQLRYRVDSSSYQWAIWHGYYLVMVVNGDALTLSANLPGGEVEQGTKVYLTASQSDADIYYTLNGSTPTASSTKYTSSGITINESCTLKAIAMKSGYDNSDIMTWTYTIAKPDGIAIDATNFPDDNFRNYLLSQDYGKDGVLTEAEIKNVRQISVSYKNISSLKGIEHFTALTTLDCHSNQLTTLDVSKNTALTTLYCYSNQLTTLDVSKSTALTFLSCYSNQLTTLDVSNTALTDLSCGINQLTALDVSKNTALTRLFCYRNQLTVLDVSKNTALETLQCYDNQLTVLDVSKNMALKDLQCSNNQLTALDVSKNTALTNLSCGGNPLTTLDVSKNTALTKLSCFSNQLTALDVSKNTALTTLSCYRNQLPILDLSKNMALTNLVCHMNQIKGAAMDALISSLPQNNTNEKCFLRVIYRGTEGEEDGNVCTKKQVAAAKAKGWTPQYNNNMQEWIDYEGSDDEPNYDIVIDETHFPDTNFRNYLLSQDYGKDGVLTEAEIKKVTSIYVPEKGISNLKGIEYFTALTSLSCFGNQLTTLDVSKNVLLVLLDCSNNIIKGTAMDNLISSLPMNTTNEEHSLGIWEVIRKDENVCTKAQVAAIKAKGWTPYCVDGDNELFLGYYYGCDADPISIKLPEIETVNVNSTTQLTATVEPAYITPELVWSSSAENIAMVTSTGKVLGVSAGAAIITVRTSNGLTAECFVIVQDASGIEDVKTSGNADAPIYTLSGQKVANVKKGIYIVGGRKVVVK